MELGVEGLVTVVCVGGEVEGGEGGLASTGLGVEYKLSGGGLC